MAGVSSKFSSYGYPLDSPRYSSEAPYKYIYAEPDPNAPFHKEYEETEAGAGKATPAWLYRAFCPSSVFLAVNDKAALIKVLPDGRTVTGEKGYSTVRATHSVNHGVWYWEAKIEDIPKHGAARIGWAQEFAELEAPCGYDKFGYSWRSLYGTIFHQANGRHYSDGYGLGDVLGFLIILPESDFSKDVPLSLKKERLIQFRKKNYYEIDPKKTKVALAELQPLAGSKIIFFKNGVCQGVAFSDIYAGAYYPAVSLFESTTVSVNFGPEFQYPPTEDYPMFKPMHDRAEETIKERNDADAIFFSANEGKLTLE